MVEGHLAAGEHHVVKDTVSSENVVPSKDTSPPENLERAKDTSPEHNVGEVQGPAGERRALQSSLRSRW
jgi:hypothetical protein